MEWLARATNWAKFTATASLGVIHKVIDFIHYDWPVQRNPFWGGLRNINLLQLINTYMLSDHVSPGTGKSEVKKALNKCLFLFSKR